MCPIFVCLEYTSAGVLGEKEAGLGGVSKGAVPSEGGGRWGACESCGKTQCSVWWDEERLGKMQQLLKLLCACDS